MKIKDILAPDCTLISSSIHGRKRVFVQIADLIHRQHPEIEQNEVFESMTHRERLGSTAIGFGVAIPHGRISVGKQAAAALVRIPDGIDFDAPDAASVDLVFALVVPQDTTKAHLQILAQVAKMFNDTDFRAQLRKAENSRELYNLVAEFH